MALVHVLVVTNLWPYEDDPSYGCFVQDQMESLKPLGVDYDVLFINGRKSRWNYARAFAELRRRLREQRYDLIHAQMGLAGIVARSQRGLPLLVSFLGNDVLGKFDRPGRATLFDYFLRSSSFVLARLAQAVIVKSEEMKRKLRLDSVYVIPNGVDTALFQPMDRKEARRQLGLDAEKKLVLFPYSPANKPKRFDLVSAAITRARSQVPGLELLQVNGVPHHRMPLYMNAADALVTASEVEGSPNAVKEAMAVNLPVVSVPVGDVPELFEGTEGNYLASRTEADLAEKLAQACRSGVRANSREKVVRELSRESVARRIVGVYESVLEKQR